jgi:hypothetical protein
MEMDIRSRKSRLLRHRLSLAGSLTLCLALSTSCTTATSSSGGSSSSTEIAAVVLDSVGGSTISGATVAVTDSSGNSIGTFTTGSDGEVSLTSSLTAGSTYSLTASMSGRASSEMLDYVATAGTTVSLYCFKKAITSVASTPPILVSLEYSSDSGSSWSALSAGLSLAAGFEIRASVAGVAAVEATSWSGFGVKLDLDSMPTTDNGYEASSYEQKSVEDTDSSSATYGKFLTTAIFNLSSYSFTSGSHSLELVAYDCANNRVEKRVAFTISTTNSSGGSLSNASFSSPGLYMLSYGKSSSSFAFTRKTLGKALTTSSSSSSYYSELSFYLTNGQSYASILGFDVYRSSDGSSYSKIATVNYGELYTNSSYGSAFYYLDRDSSLELGTTYYYKVKAFSSDSYYSSFSPVLSASFVAPFKDYLASPSDGTSISSSPTFTFTISNTDLWSSDAADYFYFSLLVRDMAGNVAFYGEYRYDFAADKFEAPKSYYGSSSSYAGAAYWSGGYKAVSGISYSSGVISIAQAAYTSSYVDTYLQSTGLSLSSGTTYEWDVYGDWPYGTYYGDVGTSSAMESAFFEKDGTVASSSSSPGGSSGTAKGLSFANTYAGGAASSNGSFEFSYE